MSGFVTKIPELRPTTHERIFYGEELIEALCAYMRTQGHDIPDGETYVFGLERPHGPGCQEQVRLVIRTFE